MEFLKAHVDYIILGILGLMSLIMLWKVVERYIFFARMDVRDYPNIHELNIALERNLTPIYTIGSNAPYVGLLGTVTGILITFYDMGQSGGNVDAAQSWSPRPRPKSDRTWHPRRHPLHHVYNMLSRKVDIRREKWLSYQSGNAK